MLRSSASRSLIKEKLTLPLLCRFFCASRYTGSKNFCPTGGTNARVSGTTNSDSTLSLGLRSMMALVVSIGNTSPRRRTMSTDGAPREVACVVLYPERRLSEVMEPSPREVSPVTMRSPPLLLITDRLFTERSGLPGALTKPTLALLRLVPLGTSISTILFCACARERTEGLEISPNSPGWNEPVSPMVLEVLNPLFPLASGWFWRNAGCTTLLTVAPLALMVEGSVAVW
mmetsp:Transcript_9571/g.16674  ORF Transcript_9571/g.16674 Transcript_9571/m.16674 type:complete len:230 (-) Transcript_9571:2585-3274(-)